MGDYLDVNGNSALGEELKIVCSLGGKLATFSIGNLTDSLDSRHGGIQLQNRITCVAENAFQQT